MLQLHPGELDYRARGLHDVEVDIASPTSSPMIIVQSTALAARKAPNADWVSGWASLEPTPEYPLLDDKKPEGRVRFHFCPVGDTTSAMHFRRQAQVKALDTVPISKRRLKTHVSPSMSTANCYERRFRPPVRVVAWWEDDLGLWLVLDGSNRRLTPFSEAWADVVGREWPLVAEPPHASADGHRWATACDLLLQAVVCLQALHDRYISLNWCHPSCFGVLDNSVVVNRLWDATALPGLSLPTLLPPALASSPLFTRDPLHHNSSNLSEGYVFRHLRYLAPEAAISRRVSPSNDIYGWGVFAYELVTGTTIDGGPDNPDLEDIDLLADIHRHVTTEVTSPSDYLSRVAAIGASGLDMPPKQLSDIIMLALAKDPEDRYHCLDALAYDLRKLSQVCRASGDLSKFSVGEVDRMSRFNLPASVIERDGELEVLEAAFTAVVQGTASSRVINVWGQSGNGKTRLVEEWATKLEASDHGALCLVGHARSDEHTKKPLASFIQIFQSLLDRVLTDPREDAKDWLDKLRHTLTSHWPFFVSLLPVDARRLIGEENCSPHPPAIDWDKFLTAFQLWCRRFIQLFATSARPLVLIVDDTQWLPQSEVDLWRQIVDGAPSLNHVVIVSITRTESPAPPHPSTLFSASSLSIAVNRLTEDGVVAYIDMCLNHRVASSGEAIASFLYGETAGSPLFLRTLMTTLLKERVVEFDYDRLQWRFDLVTLQAHLSDASFDAYLESVMRRLPPEVQEILMFLSYLPAAGFPLDRLSEALRKPAGEIENVLQMASALGGVILRPNHIRFTHDRQRVAAQRLVSPEQRGKMHQRVFQFLTRSDNESDYLFDAVSQALTARSEGTEVGPAPEVLDLLLRATQRATERSNFAGARNFVESAQHIIDETGGIATWVETQRALIFRWVRLATAVCGVFHEHQAAFATLQAIRPLCRTSTEKITIATLYTRQLVAANMYLGAMDQLLQTLDEFGYNPENPKALSLWHPETVEDVEAFGRELKDEPTEEDDHVLIMSLIGYAGPTIYITQPKRRYSIFRLGLSIAKAVGRIHESTSYLLAIHSITITDPSIQYALRKLSMQFASLRPNHFLTNSALVALGAQAHCFMPFEKVTDVMDVALETSINVADYEVASYVVALDLGTRIFSKVPCAWDIVSRRYEVVKPYATASHHLLLNMPYQYSECLAHPRLPKPWEMDGDFFGPKELDSITGLKMHSGVYDCLTMRLKLLYDAPKDELIATLRRGRRTRDFNDGLSFGLEMEFLLAVAAIRTGTETDLIERARTLLQKYTEFSPDIRARLDFLNVLEQVHRNPLGALGAVERVIEDLDKQEQHILSGMLNFLTAGSLIEHTGSTKIAAGFISAAFMAYKEGDYGGVCEVIRAKYPTYCSSMPLNTRGPSFYMHPESVQTPAWRRVSLSTMTSDGTVPSIPRTTDFEPTPSNDNLDTLALMRSSLALAQEKDSLVLLCTLLRILCQFSRCDYAAIGLADEDDKSTVRLKAAGPFQRIVSYDLDLSDDTAQMICPTAVMLHVARTGIPITKPAKLSRLRNDPFFSGRQPRTVLCLPITNHGNHSGVILLMSMTSTSSAVQSESAREVVSTLATFAYIIHMHHVFTSRLKTEVAQRTRELSNALQAKTQFLSQCSHELRSPLAAIMGLAAVLEASPGLTEVQREHLATISASGQDLLALISNILDHSKLESHSVQLENIPFNIRETVESALDVIAPVAQSKNVELTMLTTHKSDPPGIIGDPFRVKQILLNLLSNAVKFTPPGEPGKRTARVTVHRSWEEIENDGIKISLTVADTGVGIPASKLNKLFKSFSQVDESITRSYGGSGLGLVISRDLARLLGGDCLVESEFGKGSKFTFTFVAKKDPQSRHLVLRTFPEPQSVFILSPGDMAWGRLLEDDVREFNCSPTWFTEPPQRAMRKGHPQGLNAGEQFSFLILDTSLIDKERLREIRRLQPNSKIFYVVRVTEITREMERLNIPREAILARPLKFQSLHDAIIPPPRDGSRNKAARNKRVINRNLAQEKPLDVLVVDDSPVNIAVCRRILELYGYQNVDSAADGLQATELAEKKRYDLILLDLQMPVLDGFGALERIQNSPLAGEPCCVSLSANVDKATQTRCVDAGFYACMSKPIDIPRLGELLAEVYHLRHKGGSLPPSPLKSDDETVN